MVTINSVLRTLGQLYSHNCRASLPCLLANIKQAQVLCKRCKVSSIIWQYVAKLYFTAALVICLLYRSPELIDNPDHITAATDMWSWACTVIHMASGSIPFKGLNMVQIVQRVCLQLSERTVCRLCIVMCFSHHVSQPSLSSNLLMSPPILWGALPELCVVWPCVITHNQHEGTTTYVSRIVDRYPMTAHCKCRSLLMLL